MSFSSNHHEHFPRIPLRGLTGSFSRTACALTQRNRPCRQVSEAGHVDESGT